MIQMFFKFTQRFFDLFFIFLTSPVWFSIFIIFCCVSFFVEGRPVFYTQKRVGLNGRVFEVFKIRTMSNDFDLPENERTTAYTRFLRRSSIDEIPQLINVLIGDMSLVGPRPLPYELLRAGLKPNQNTLRESVVPGLTGFSQISSKGVKRSLHVKFKYDNYYVTNKNICLYFYILVLTVKVLLIRFLVNKTGETL